jgi:hypothetical protein
MRAFLLAGMLSLVVATAADAQESSCWRCVYKIRVLLTLYREQSCDTPLRKPYLPCTCLPRLGPGATRTPGYTRYVCFWGGPSL